MGRGAVRFELVSGHVTSHFLESVREMGGQEGTDEEERGHTSAGSSYLS